MAANGEINIALGPVSAPIKVADGTLCLICQCCDLVKLSAVNYQAPTIVRPKTFRLNVAAVRNDQFWS